MTMRMPPIAPVINANPDLLTVMQVAEMVGVDTCTVRKYINEGKLATVTLPGGSKRILIKRQVLERFMRLR